MEDIELFYKDLSMGFLNTQMETLTPRMVALDDLTQFIEGKISSKMSFHWKFAYRTRTTLTRSWLETALEY